VNDAQVTVVVRSENSSPSGSSWPEPFFQAQGRIWPSVMVSKWSHRIVECGEHWRKMIALGVAAVDLGESRDFSLGSITFAGWESGVENLLGLIPLDACKACLRYLW